MANVTGQITILRKDFDGKPVYSRRIAWHPYTKEKGTDTTKWVGVYESVLFYGQVDLLDKTRINVKDGYEGGYIDKQGKPQRRLVIREYEVVDVPELSQVEPEDDYLPF